MIIGIPKEVKTDEFRVGATPSNVALLVEDGHMVYVQSTAGVGSGFSDDEYKKAGAKIVKDLATLYANSKLIVKVKEPQKSEYELLSKQHTLFCYLHLAPLKELTTLLVQKKVCAIAYETIRVQNELPLLKPMSEIAGKMAPIVAAHHLSRYQNGAGMLISGVVGVPPVKVLIIGAGNAGLGAAKMAVGMGADVTVINRSTPKLQQMQNILGSIKTDLYSPSTLEEYLKQSDIVISTVLIQGGAKAPKLITKPMLKKMKNGSIIIDITIDQGGISQMSKPTTHTDPIFIEEGVLHYCVANMPGAYPKTATLALTNATLPYIRYLANNGVKNSIKNDKSITLGVNVYGGFVTNEAIAKAHGFEYKALESFKI
jgi:alanine dehydrogenase